MNSLTVSELKTRARALGFKGYSTMRKQELIHLLTSYYHLARYNTNGESLYTQKGTLRLPKTAKYERCVQKVKAKQSKTCAVQGYKGIDSTTGKRCVVPWAVCSRARF